MTNKASNGSILKQKGLPGVSIRSSRNPAVSGEQWQSQQYNNNISTVAALRLLVNTQYWKDP